MVYNEIPDLSQFGCLVFATTSNVQRRKLGCRAIKCVFLSYKDGIKGFTLFDMNQKNIFVTRNVIFYENNFSFYKDIIDTNLDTHDVFKHLFPSIFDNDIVVPTPVSDIVFEIVLPSNIPTSDSSKPLHLLDIDVLQHQHSDPQPLSVRVSTRLKQQLEYLKEYHTTFFSSKKYYQSFFKY